MAKYHCLPYLYCTWGVMWSGQVHENNNKVSITQGAVDEEEGLNYEIDLRDFSLCNKAGIPKLIDFRDSITNRNYRLN